MSISSITSASSSAYSTADNNNEVTQLKKQKANLLKEIQKVQQSNDNEKTKQEEIKLLQQQIQLIDAQIQGASNTSSTMNTQSTDNRKGQDPFLTDAAKVLGISSDDLKTELESGKDLQTIVEDKGLTIDDFQQQMTALRNNGPAGSAQNAPPPPPSGKPTEEYMTDAASVLGISSDDLESQLDSGTDLLTIIKNQNVSVEDFQQQMITLFNSRHAADVDQIGNIVNTKI